MGDGGPRSAYISLWKCNVESYQRQRFNSQTLGTIDTNWIDSCNLTTINNGNWFINSNFACLLEKIFA